MAKTNKQFQIDYVDWSKLIGEVSLMQQEMIDINKRRIAIKKKALTLYKQAIRKQTQCKLKQGKKNYEVVKDALNTIINSK